MKRIFNLVLITLMTVSMLTGESVSRLKATSSTTSIFKVDSDVTEPGWESALSDGDDEYVKRCHAGDSVTKDPTLKNIFKYDTYAFMMVETDYCDGIPFAEIDSVNDGWTEVTDISPGFLNDSYVRIFKYDSVLTPNERTGPLFESVTVLDTCSAGDYEINISGILIDSAVDEDEAVKIAKGNLLYYPPIKDRQEAISAYKTNFYANVTEAMAFNGDQSLYPRIYYTFDGDNTSVINITIPSFLYPLQNGQLFRCWSYTTQIIDIYNREFMFDLYPGDYLGTITGPVENKRYNAIYAYTSYFVGNTVRGYKTDRITNMFRIEELPLLMMLFTATPSVYMAKPSESSEQEIMAPEQIEETTIVETTEETIEETFAEETVEKLTEEAVENLTEETEEMVEEETTDVTTYDSENKEEESDEDMFTGNDNTIMPFMENEFIDDIFLMEDTSEYQIPLNEIFEEKEEDNFEEMVMEETEQEVNLIINDNNEEFVNNDYGQAK